MIGDTVVADGIEYEVAFDGRQSLIGNRASKSIAQPTPQTRLYHRTGKYSKRAKEEVRAIVVDLDQE